MQILKNPKFSNPLHTKLLNPFSTSSTSSSPPAPLHGYAFYKSINSPKHICAPMADQSELPFRMLCRKYNTHLCYTPMLHSTLIVNKPNYLEENFSTCPEDRPLFIQLAGNDPEILLQAAKKVQNQCDAVDINLGCPQGIAKKHYYGSYLLENFDLVKRIIATLTENLAVPVTCKIRVFPEEERTLRLMKIIEEAGCSLVTVHGRTKEQNKQKVGKCDWGIIKKIKENVKIPVFANGGIYDYQDVEDCMRYTGVDGVMSSEGLLENPALFSGEIYDLDDLTEEYLDMCDKYGGKVEYIKPHLFKMLHSGFERRPEMREELVNGKNVEDFRRICEKIREVRGDMRKEEKLGWYKRYMKEEEKLYYNDWRIEQRDERMSCEM